MKHIHYRASLMMGALFLLLVAIVPETQGQVQQMPYVTDFENQAPCGTDCGDPCILTNGWTNTTDDDQDWTAHSGSTSSGSTGPSNDHTLGSIGGGTYLYMETSTPCNGGDDTAHVVSPPINLAGTTNPVVSYWYHLYGATMGEFHVDLSDDGGATWQLDITPAAGTDSGDVWLNRVVSLVPWIGDTIHIRFRGISGSSFTSDMAIDDIAFFQILPIDAGVTDIPTPASPGMLGMNATEVIVTNLGTDTLTSAMINWTVNGVAQPAASWTGSLAPGASSTPQAIGMSTLVFGFNSIKAWTDMPNGMVDQQPGNDTTEVSVLACDPLTGAYTVGGATADFATPEDAAVALNTCGISGPVVLNINPGTYSGNMMINEITGADAANTITIDGGDAANTKLTWGGNQGIATITLMGADYVTIKNLTVENTGTTDAWGIQMRDTATWNTIDSCIIMMDPAGTSDVEGIVASNSNTSSFTEGLNAIHTTISNNMIMGGDRGIHIEGAFATPYPCVGNMILNNTIMGAEDTGIYLDNLDSTTISGNIIQTRGSGGDGIYTFDQQNYTITYNQVQSNDFGIYISDGNFDYAVSSQSLIANNMVYAATDDALYLDDVERTNVYHNTCVGVQGGYFNDIDTLDIRNNIFASASALAVDFVDASSGIDSLTFDYNLLYSGGADLADDGTTTYTDLASWQAGSPAINVNSVSGNPVFASPFDDLHAKGIAANDVGDNSVGITMDIDGDMRPLAPSTTVDIGADEYTPLTTDAAPTAIIAPAPFVCGDSMQMISAVVFNDGASPITALPIQAIISGDFTDSLALTSTDTIAAFSSDTILVGSLNTALGGIYQIDLTTALPGDQDPGDDTLATASFTALPIVPTAMEDTVLACGADTAILMANSFAGASYAWYQDAVGDSIVGTGASFVVPSIAAQNTYFLAYGDIMDTLQTTLNAGNSAAGNMFDIVASQTVNIDSFMVHGSTGIAVVEVYIKQGSYIGSETAAGDWTLVGSDSVDFQGIGTLVAANVGPISLIGGQSYGIYITRTTGTLSYTNGGMPTTTYTDGTLTLSAGAGKSYPFGSTFSPRIWNGVVAYSSAGCSDTRVPVTAVTEDPATAMFSSAATELDVTFTDMSTGDPMTYAWDFGDGTTDTVASPTHTYAFPGMYTACLIVSDECGSDTICEVLTLSCAAPSAGFSAAANDLEVTFTDTSTTGGVTMASYAWDFGDGNTSMMASPVHMYAAPDTYTVCLVVSDTCGADTVCESLIVTCMPPTASFDIARDADTLSFSNTSMTTADTATYAWDFGDGTTSTDMSPTHVYDSSGLYTICLIVTESCGTDTICQELDFFKTRIEDLLHIRDLQLYPNPTYGQAILKAESARQSI